MVGLNYLGAIFQPKWFCVSLLSCAHLHTHNIKATDSAERTQGHGHQTCPAAPCPVCNDQRSIWGFCTPPASQEHDPAHTPLTHVSVPQDSHFASKSFRPFGLRNINGKILHKHSIWLLKQKEGDIAQRWVARSRSEVQQPTLYNCDSDIMALKQSMPNKTDVYLITMTGSSLTWVLHKDNQC